MAHFLKPSVRDGAERLQDFPDRRGRGALPSRVVRPGLGFLAAPFIVVCALVMAAAYVAALLDGIGANDADPALFSVVPYGLAFEMAEVAVGPDTSLADALDGVAEQIARSVANSTDDGLREATGTAADALADLAAALRTGNAASIVDAQAVAVELLQDSMQRKEAALEAFFDHQSSRAAQVERVVLGILMLAAAGLICVLGLFRREALANARRSQAENRVARLAYTDALTGIANRTRFFDTLACALANSDEVTVCLLDLDQFRELNERRGRALGDAVLRDLAQRLSRAASNVDGHAARLGSDNFAVLLPFDDAQKVAIFLKRMSDECCQPVSKGNDMVVPSVSIGVASASHLPDGIAITHESMIRVADFALNAARAKESGNGVAVYDTDMESSFVDRKTMVEQLPRAMADGALEVYLQPKANLETAEVTGFEALVRWTRSGVSVPPQDLIRIAEDSGLILDLDRYMLDHAIGVVADWNRRHKTDFSLAVNISARHVFQDDIVAVVADSLEKHRMPPELLTVEITETMELGNWKNAEEALSRLRALNCRISIDDFGIGYSSLAYLLAIKVDELKVDKSLIDGIESGESLPILEAVLHLSRQLNLYVVVEGVEREAQAECLIKAGFIHGQGYLYGRPRPAIEWLADVTYGVTDPSARDEPLPKVLQPRLAGTEAL